MSKIETGGPAFPTTWTDDSDSNAYAPDGSIAAPESTVQLAGMTLRDYFAAKAMEGRVSGGWIPGDENAVARECYKLADAMLKARNQ